MEHGNLGSGIYRAPLKNGGLSPIYRCRMTVPEDVRETIGRREWDASLNTDSATTANATAADYRKRWKREISDARSRARHSPLNLIDFTATLSDHCADFVMWTVLCPSYWGEVSDPHLDPATHEQWRRGTDLGIETNHLTAKHLLLLENAIQSKRWGIVPRFGDMLDHVTSRSGIDVASDHPQLDEVRLIFARQLLERLLAAEKVRLQFAHWYRESVLNAASSQDILAEARGIASECHVTVRQLVETYKSERSIKYGEESTNRKYGHIFRALTELIGEHREIASIRRDECRKIRDTLRRLPAYVGRKFRGLSLIEAIEAADASEEEIERLAPNTVSNYMANLVAIMNFAVAEDWIVKNPAVGLVDGDMPVVKRRGLRSEELDRLFSSLEDERKSGSWRYWLPALALYSGARCKEMAQLKPSDHRVEDGVHYLSFDEFDETGARTTGKRLKTNASTRVVPIHAELIRSGFIEFLDSRAAAETIFPIAAGKNGPAHEVSRWFGRHMDAIGLSDPSLVFHSFRHGFRDQCDWAGLSPRITNALGGWTSTAEGDRYGNPRQVVELKRAIDKIAYGTFSLVG